MCDGTHKRLDGTEFVKKRFLFRPHAFTVQASAEYHLCNCKQTCNRPFCDGTHRRSDIQEAVKS
jgi:CDGSH-type Zn-finger protein